MYKLITKLHQLVKIHYFYSYRVEFLCLYAITRVTLKLFVFVAKIHLYVDSDPE